MKFAPRYAWLPAALLLVAAPSLRAAEVRSPDGRIGVIVDVGKGGIPQYSMNYRGVNVMPAANLGLRFQAQPAFDQGFRVAGSAQASHDGRWEQPWGERRFVRDHYNELLVNLALLAACYAYIVLVIVVSGKMEASARVSSKTSRKFLHMMIGNLPFIIQFFSFNTFPLNFIIGPGDNDGASCGCAAWPL